MWESNTEHKDLLKCQINSKRIPKNSKFQKSMASKKNGNSIKVMKIQMVPNNEEQKPPKTTVYLPNTHKIKVFQHKWVIQ